MFKVGKIVKTHYATFYDYDTGTQRPVRRRILIFSILAIAAPILSAGNFGSFLESTISALAILVGFSFSAMFFLLDGKNSKHTENCNSESLTIETKLRIEKLETLKSELFWNLTFFNLISVLCIICALYTIMPNFSFSLFLDAISENFTQTTSNTIGSIFDATTAFLRA